MPQAAAQPDTRESSDVAALVRLHHRRRGWAWVAVGSVIGLALYAAIDVNLFNSLTGTAETLSVIPVVVLLALVLVGLVDVIVDTTRLHRADAAVRVSAKGSVSHHPLYAHAYRWPPRHPASWVAAIFMLVAMTCITAYILPQEVNAWGYVVGAEHQDTFNPVSYATTCATVGRGFRCDSVTVGYMSRTGANVIWGPQVPLGQPFSARDPLWVSGTGRNLIGGDSSAIPTIVAGLFFDGVALLLLYVLMVLLRDTSPRRRQPVPVPAAAGPGAAHVTHHPDRGQHSDGTRRSARRGRGRRGRRGSRGSRGR
jgi:hypothetical protein